MIGLIGGMICFRECGMDGLEYMKMRFFVGKHKDICVGLGIRLMRVYRRWSLKYRAIDM